MSRKPMRIVLDILFTAVCLAAATVIALMLHSSSMLQNNVVAIYILAVLMVSIRTQGYLLGIVASAVGVLCVNYFFTYPEYAFNFTLEGYPLTFLVMLIASIMAGATASKLRDAAELAEKNERETRALNRFGQELLSTRGVEEILELTKGFIKELCGMECVMFLPDSPLAEGPEREAVRECMAKRKQTGCGTDIYGCWDYRYFPVELQERAVAAAGIRCGAAGVPPADELNAIKLVLTQVAFALSRQIMAEEQHRVVVQSEKEKLRANLLRAISHDLRTPLTGIMGASAAIMDNDKHIDKRSHDSLIRDIHEDAEWLLRMVENLLAVTRVDRETQLKKTPEAAEEVVASAVHRVRKMFPRAVIRVSVPEEFIMVPMDPTLISQVLINLMENSVRHSGDMAKIELSVEYGAAKAVFSVRDHGRGFKEVEDIFAVFVRKNRSASDDTRGLGIGLSLCRSIIRAHGGEISGMNHPEGGALFSFTLPLT